MRRGLIAIATGALLAVPAQAAVATPTPSASPTPTASSTPTPPTYVERTIVVGTTAQGRTIKAYYQGWPTATTGRTLLVLGQMHGNEKAGKTTIAWLRKNQKPKRGTAIWLIPTMNPDGDARSRRVNSRGVDLNRNWPTSGWTSTGKGSVTWGGPRKGSEREVKAMMRFLAREKPDYIVSLHQPFGVIGTLNKDKAFEKRLSSGLGLKLKSLGVGTAKAKTPPTLTGWYNRFHGRNRAAITVEYRKKVSKAWSGTKAGRAITRAARVR